jgi:menaquinone-dependent protoporphyrinogen oxidase
MAQNVLVAYGSKHGGTREIAERIGQVLQEAGLAVTTCSADEADDVASYDAVVVGSGVYAGQWRREAVGFLRDNEAVLAERPVWIFSSGPTGEGDPLELVKGWRFPEGHKELADRVSPRDLMVFHGVIDNDKLNLFEKLIVRMVKAPAGDFRDWEAISAWAGEIAAALQVE